MLAGLGLGLELRASKAATSDAIEDARLGATQAHAVEVPSEMNVDWTSVTQLWQPTETVSTDPTESEPEDAPSVDLKPAPSVDLTDKEGNPIRSDRSLDKLKLTSELPDSTFAELKRIQIEGISGSINFMTQGFGRYTAPDSRCGSVVVVYTTMGSVQFDGTAMMVRLSFSMMMLRSHPHPNSCRCRQHIRMLSNSGLTFRAPAHSILTNTIVVAAPPFSYLLWTRVDRTGFITYFFLV